MVGVFGLVGEAQRQAQEMCSGRAVCSLSLEKGIVINWQGLFFWGASWAGMLWKSQTGSLRL